jgi:hypothetical protein
MDAYRTRDEFERGIMLFAFDNEAVDYIELAAFCAKRIKKHLKVPVCVVTDNPEKAMSFGVFDLCREINCFNSMPNIRNYTPELVGQFNNHNRFWAQILSPFYETIVIDTDYMVSSDKLNVLWGCNKDFLIQVDSVGLDGGYLDTMVSNSTIQSTWATILYFKNTEFTRRFFRLIEYIAYSWEYFREQYKIETPVYRNDYSFAIALQIMNGGVDCLKYHAIPFTMVTSRDRDCVFEITDNSVTLDFNGQLIKIEDQDVHVLHKPSLIEKLRA